MCSKCWAIPSHFPEGPVSGSSDGVSLDPTDSHAVNIGRKHTEGISSGTHYTCPPQVQKEEEKNMDSSAESGELVPELLTGKSEGEMPRHLSTDLHACLL